MAYLADKTKEYCCYCERWIVWPLQATKEHLVPKSIGGSNNSLNIRPCCHQCNGWRGNKPLSVWQQEFKEFVEKGWDYKTYTHEHLVTITKNLIKLRELISENCSALWLGDVSDDKRFHYSQIEANNNKLIKW